MDLLSRKPELQVNQEWSLYLISLVPRPSRGRGKEGLVHTACATFSVHLTVKESVKVQVEGGRARNWFTEAVSGRAAQTARPRGSKFSACASLLCY